MARFVDEEAAARAYDRAVVLLHGTHGLGSRIAATNFPPEQVRRLAGCGVWLTDCAASGNESAAMFDPSCCGATWQCSRHHMPGPLSMNPPPSLPYHGSPLLQALADTSPLSQPLLALLIKLGEEYGGAGPDGAGAARVLGELLRRMRDPDEHGCVPSVAAVLAQLQAEGAFDAAGAHERDGVARCAWLRSTHARGGTCAWRVRAHGERSVRLGSAGVVAAQRQAGWLHGVHRSHSSRHRAPAHAACRCSPCAMQAM